MLDRWEAEHPDSDLVITRLQPGFVYGPDFSNPALEMMGTPLAVLPDDDGRTHLIHQDDLARAFCEACFADHPGAYPDRDRRVDLAGGPGRALGRAGRARARSRRSSVALDAAHALRLSPVSSDWAVSGDREARLGRARERARLGALDDLPRVGAGAARAAGRRLRYADGPPRPEVAERMLEVPTAWLREAARDAAGARRLRPRRHSRAPRARLDRASRRADPSRGPRGGRPEGDGGLRARPGRPCPPLDPARRRPRRRGPERRPDRPSRPRDLRGPPGRRDARDRPRRDRARARVRPRALRLAGRA